VLSLIKGLGPGGAETLLVGGVRLADPARVRHEVAYLLPWKDALVPRLREAGVPVHCFDVRDERAVGWALRLRRLLLRAGGGFDVLHVHSPYAAGIARLVVRSLPRAARPAVVTTEHNAWDRFSRPTRWLNSLTYPLGSAWIAVSDEVRDSVRPGMRSRVEVVVHGVDLAAVRAQRRERAGARAELGIGPDDVAVVTVANLTQQKGYADLFAAARSVLDRDLGSARVRFVCVGQGPLETELARLHADLGLGERVQRLGFRPDAVRILAAGDVFCLASHWEGYPVALMEALAIGLPVVATAVGGVADAIADGKSGLLVPPGRPDELAAALESVAVDPELRRRLAEGAAAAADRYDLSRAAARIEAIYRFARPATSPRTSRKIRP
jgi:glycosyltransferase involved in cell wall biosynthesis